MTIQIPSWSFLPYERFEIRTTLSRAEIHQRLVEVVEPGRPLSRRGVFGELKHPYRGQVEDDSFEIARIIRYRNSFLPIIKGEIRDDLDRRVIRITMHPNALVLSIMVIWLGAVGLVMLFSLAEIAQYVMGGTESFDASTLIPVGMFLFGVLLTMVPFKVESAKSRKFLYELFDEPYG